MTKELASALNVLYSINKEYEDFASNAPLGYDEKADLKLDEYDEKIFAAEGDVFDLIRGIEDEDEAYSVQSLVYQWYRIPRYLARHAA